MGDPVAHHRRVKELFLEAASLSGEARSRFLDVACGTDTALRAEVEELVRLEEEDGDPGDGTPLGASEGPVPGQRIEGDRAYRLVEEIGRGGMGRVFLAERIDGDFTQRVALKVVTDPFRRGRAGAGELAERFRRERRILAQLDHSAIARLVDGGELPDGSPFLAMELVDGVPIDRYCREHGLGVRERVRLFLDVCAAVESAHRALVVHRDLKPANVLVTPSGAVKLLDFGIAKLLGPESDPGLATATGLQPLTPRYASPEQVRGDPVTTATDVYSLGVVLFELLTGTSPYPVEGPSPVAWVRAVCDEEPRTPSTVAARGSGAPDPGPDSRATGLPEDVASLLRGDLDAILLQALRKDPSARYGSVREMAEDLERHLDGRPVLARRRTLVYTTGRFVRRHRAAVLGSVVVVALLAAWLASLAAGTERARLAQRFAGEARALETAMRIEYLLPPHDLRPARARVEARMEDIRASMEELGPQARGPGLLALGRGALALGDLTAARRHLDAAMEATGGDDPEVVAALAECLARQYGEATQTFREAWTLDVREGASDLERDLRDPALDLLRRLDAAGQGVPELTRARIAFLERRLEDGRDLAARVAERAPWLYEADLLAAESLLVAAHDRQDEVSYEEAIELYREADAALRHVVEKGESDPRGWRSVCHLQTFVLEAQGVHHRRLEPESLARAREDCRTWELLDPADWEALSLLAMTWFREGEDLLENGQDPTVPLRRHEELGRRVIALRPDRGLAFSTTSLGLYTRARWEIDQGRADRGVVLLEEAVPLARRAIEVSPRELAGYNSVGVFCRFLAQARSSIGGDPGADFACSVEALRSALEIQPEFVYGWSNLASTLQQWAVERQARGFDAVDLTEEAVRAWDRTHEIHPDHPLPSGAPCLWALLRAVRHTAVGDVSEARIAEGVATCDAVAEVDPRPIPFERSWEIALAGLERAVRDGAGVAEARARAMRARELYVEREPAAADRTALRLDLTAAARRRGGNPSAALDRAHVRGRRLRGLEEIDARDRIALVWLERVSLETGGSTERLRRLAEELRSEVPNQGLAEAALRLADVRDGVPGAEERLRSLEEERPLLRPFLSYAGGSPQRGG